MNILSPDDQTCLTGLPWAILQTNTGQEFALECDMVRSGFVLYVPRHVERRQPPRRGQPRATPQAVRALFASYAFLLGNAAAASRFVACDFDTTKRTVRRLPNLISQPIMDRVQDAERMAQRERWGDWSPEVSTVLHGLHSAITGVLPKRFTNLSALQAIAR